MRSSEEQWGGPALRAWGSGPGCCCRRARRGGSSLAGPSQCTRRTPWRSESAQCGPRCASRRAPHPEGVCAARVWAQAHAARYVSPAGAGWADPRCTCSRYQMPSAVARSQMLSEPCDAGLSGVCTICGAPHARAPRLRRLLARRSVDATRRSAARRTHVGSTPRTPARALARSQRRGACIRGFGVGRTRGGVLWAETWACVQSGCSLSATAAAPRACWARRPRRCSRARPTPPHGATLRWLAGFARRPVAALVFFPQKKMGEKF